VEIFLVFIQTKFIAFFKILAFLLFLVEELSVKSKPFLWDPFKYYHPIHSHLFPAISSLQIFFEILSARFLCAMRASRRTSSILNVINCIQYSYCLDVTSCVWVIRYRRFGKVTHKHLHEAKYSLLFGR